MRLKWFGHVWRVENDLTNKALTETIHTKRPLSRPRTRCKNTTGKDICVVDRNVSVDLEFDKERWRGFLVATQVLQGLWLKNEEIILKCNFLYN